MTDYISSIDQDSLNSLCEEIGKYNKINPAYFDRFQVKRGLRNSDGTGVMAGLTKMCNVRGPKQIRNGPGYYVSDGERVPIDGRLIYRGIDVREIISGCEQEGRFGFEEVVWLLLFGTLPSKRRLEIFKNVLAESRELPNEFIEDMIMKAPSHNIMNKLSRSVLALYSYDENPDDTSVENVLRQSIQLLAQVPMIMSYAYQVKRRNFYHESMYLHPVDKTLSTAESVLYSIRADKKFTPEEAHMLDICLMLHAEHGGGNNSTFATRVLTSSGTDTYSAISAGIGSLKGPKHGGANIKVAEMVEYIKQGVEDITDADQVADFLKKILRKEAGDGSGLIYGMGHAVYTLSDPRAVILKEHARKFAENTEFEDEFKLLELIETLTPNILEELRGDKKVMCANVDLYSGLVYKLLGIPEDLFTPLFTVARVAGWSAHRMEELMTGGKIIRPAYKSVCAQRKYVRLDERLDSYPGELKYIPSDERA